MKRNEKLLVLLWITAILSVAIIYFLTSEEPLNTASHDHGANLVHEHRHAHSQDFTHGHSHQNWSDDVVHTHQHEHGHDHAELLKNTPQGVTVIGHDHDSHGVYFYCASCKSSDDVIVLRFWETDGENLVPLELEANKLAGSLFMANKKISELSFEKNPSQGVFECALESAVDNPNLLTMIVPEILINRQVFEFKSSVEF
jgi:hypothetical protein